MRWLVVVLCLLPTAALATRNVSSPVVEEGAWKSEARYGFEFDDLPAQDDRFRQFYYVEYGVTDWYALRLAGRWSKTQGRANDFVSTEVEQRFQLFEKASDGWDGGLKIVYAFADNPRALDTLDLQILAQRAFGPWNVRGNIVTQQEVGKGADGGVSWTLSQQTTYKLSSDLAVGGEWFGTLGKLSEQHGIGQQQHQLGPVVSYTVNPQLTIETGYLFGVTKPTSDGLFKLFFKADF